MAANPWDGPVAARSGPSTPCSTCGGSDGDAGHVHARAAAQNAEPDPLNQALAEAFRNAEAPVYKASLRKFMCPSDKAFLADLQKRGVKLTAYDEIYFEDRTYDGEKWVVKRFPASGSEGAGRIDLVRSGSVATDAAALYHEGVHTQQSSATPWREREFDAYAKEEQWRIKRGMPPLVPSFRTKQNGKAVVNEAGIRALVDEKYPGVAASPASAPQETVIGRTQGGDSVVSRADGTRFTRPPRKGDTYPGPQVTVPDGGIPIDMAELQCK